jgi:Zn-dependent metalloprotease
MSRCGIIPPYILREILKNGDARQQAWAWSTLTDSEQTRGRRRVLAAIAPLAVVAPGVKRRTVYDACNSYELPGQLVRGEGSRKSKDPAVNEAYDGSGATYDLYWKVYGRNSIDGRGIRIDSTVHYGANYDNAFWDGAQMVYGDGDGEVFLPFTRALDVIGHELTHGVIQYSAGLQYRGQPGALSESFADVFGSLVKQYSKRQTAERADWLIGEGLFMNGINARGIRSMKEPGTAYDDPLLGKDPQAAHMDSYVVTAEDNGGVHLNSGIPNRAFCEAALRLKGCAWEKAGRIWYKTLAERLRPDAGFRDAVTNTVTVAGELFGRNSIEQKAIRSAWSSVGL